MIRKPSGRIDMRSSAVVLVIITLALATFMTACAAKSRTAVERSEAPANEMVGEAQSVSDSDAAAAESEMLLSTEREKSEAGGGTEDTADGGSGDEQESGSAGADAGLIPAGWPEYAPVMDGFKIRYSGSDEKGMSIVAFGKAPSEDVVEYYQNLEGWEKTSDVVPTITDSKSDLKGLVVVLKRGEENLTVNIFEDDEDTIIQLLYNKD